MSRVNGQNLSTLAQQEMLRNRQRIVPVIFRQFDWEGIDENIQTILSSITYIEWPDDESKQDIFWERLTKNLPKQRTIL